jgi:hypothetical protein
VSGVQQRVWVAILAGLLISVALFFLAYSTRVSFLSWPQAIGFFACMAIVGIDSATKTDLATIAIPLNAAVYAVVILGLMRVLAKPKS